MLSTTVWGMSSSTYSTGSPRFLRPRPNSNVNVMNNQPPLLVVAETSARPVLALILVSVGEAPAAQPRTGVKRRCVLPDRSTPGHDTSCPASCNGPTDRP